MTFAFAKPVFSVHEPCRSQDDPAFHALRYERAVETAIRDDTPIISFESSRLMGLHGEIPAEEYIVPLGKADIKREEDAVTVVAAAWMVHKALAAAEAFAKEGISIAVIDPRTLVPMDVATIRASVRKTGRLVVADEAGPTASAAAEICGVVTEDPATFRALKAPVKRGCALQVPLPYSPQLERHVFPDRAKSAGRTSIMY